MKFGINCFGRMVYYDMTLEQLIFEYADTQFSYLENAYFDGDITELTPVDQFVNDCYRDVVNGYSCEIALDGTTIDFYFPDSVRFIGTDKIKEIIASAYGQ